MIRYFANGYPYSRYLFTYDSLDRCIKEIWCQDGDIPIKQRLATYDSYGNVIQEVDENFEKETTEFIKHKNLQKVNNLATLKFYNNIN